jgi:hypothetical protein
MSDPFLNYLASFFCSSYAPWYSMLSLICSDLSRKFGPEDERNRRAELHRVWAITSVTAKLHRRARRDNVV